MNVNNGATTHYLKASNYGFNIPTGATINGITVVINKSSNTSVNVCFRDNIVRLIKGGVIQTAVNRASGNNWPTALGASNYGNATDLWGSTWTPADINDPNFGAVLSVNNNSGATRTLTVDYVQINVSYTINGTINWYDASSGGTLLGTGSPFTVNTSLLSGPYTYYAECSVTPGCRAATSFTVNPGPTVSATPATQTICSGGAITDIVITNPKIDCRYHIQLDTKQYSQLNRHRSKRNGHTHYRYADKYYKHSPDNYLYDNSYGRKLLINNNRFGYC